MPEPLMIDLRAQLQRLEPYYNTLAVGLTFVLALALTYTAWDQARGQARAEARRQFEFRATQITDSIRARMLANERVLRGATSLLAATTSIERYQWGAYVQGLGLGENYPGVQGVGFALRIPAADREAHVRRIRAEGFPQYAIHPEGARSEYSPIVYLEPLSDRNLRALGYDMFSQPVRRAAMERARDTGDASISGRVTLAPETGTNAETGILIYVPAYRNAAATATVEQRRNALLGYVYSPLRLNDLIRGILGNAPELHLEIFDGAAPAGGGLLYDSAQALSHPRAAPRPVFAVTAHSVIHDRTWTLRATSLPGFEDTIDRDRPRLVLAAGIAISLMLTAYIGLLSRTRARAVRLARSMTRDLRESREQLGLALEGSNLALFDWNVATGEVRLSERWNVILGGDPRQTVTTKPELKELVHPEDLPGLQDHLHAVLKGEAPFYRLEHRVRTHGGDWKWIASNAKVTERSRDGRALRVTGTNADITERKEIERLKNEFIATVSHELRTPLTAIVGALGLLREESAGRLPAEAVTFLDMASQNSERLAALINDILDLEKIESGRMDFRTSPLMVGPLLERAVALNAPYAEKFDVRFEMRAPVPEATVPGNEDRLLQVLTNLMSNAAKFSPAGSAVTVSATVHEGSVRFAVSDKGPGVPEEFRARIFQKFAQADASDTRHKGGTGLGLSICKVIVEKLGGTIGYESTVGRGAVFYFDLPLNP